MTPDNVLMFPDLFLSREISGNQWILFAPFYEAQYAVPGEKSNTGVIKKRRLD